MKLDENNYLIRKNYVLNVIIANGLEDFIDGSWPCLTRFLDAQMQTVNPNFTAWHRFNQLIMNWIDVSLTEGMLSQTVSYSTAMEIWNSFNQIYFAAFMAHLIEIHAKTQNLKKKWMTTMEYIKKWKHLCNTLVAIGELVSYTDHLLYLFGGLDRTYNPFVTSIINWLDKPSIEEIHSLLLSYEFRLDSQNLDDQLSSLQANLSQLNLIKKNLSNLISHGHGKFPN